MTITIPISNPQVAEYHEYLSEIVNDQSLLRDQRMLANHKLKLVESLVMLYEHGTGSDTLMFNELDPALPEELKQIFERYKFKVIDGGIG